MNDLLEALTEDRKDNLNDLMVQEGFERVRDLIDAYFPTLPTLEQLSAWIDEQEELYL